MITYQVQYMIYPEDRKNKALIAPPGSFEGANDTLTLQARNDQDAYRQLRKAIIPGDKRPLAGRTYLRFCRPRLKDSKLARPRYAVS